MLTCVLENGRILIRETMAKQDEPEYIVWYWPTRFGRHDLERWDGSEPYKAEDVQVWNHGTSYNIKFPGLSVWTDSGILGNTKAVRVETAPIPRPKVRKGIEVRFTRGRWEKYLKTKGWVAA